VSASTVTARRSTLPSLPFKALVLERKRVVQLHLLFAFRESLSS
jgi:hypothetical protein